MLHGYGEFALLPFWVFNQPIGNWDMSGVTNMLLIFFSTLGFGQDIGYWNTSRVDVNVCKCLSTALAPVVDRAVWIVLFVAFCC